MGDLVFRPFVARVALCTFLALGVHGSFPLFDPGSPFLALFCVSLRLAWLGVRRVLLLPFASVRSEVFVSLRFCRSGFWTAIPVLGLFGCGFGVWWAFGSQREYLRWAMYWVSRFSFLTSSFRMTCICFCSSQLWVSVSACVCWGLTGFSSSLRPLTLYFRRTSSMVFGSTLCSCLLDCTFGNLKERHFVPFESCVLWGLCVLSIRSCSALPRWCFGPHCVRASSIAFLDNLKERHVACWGLFFCSGDRDGWCVFSYRPIVFEGSRVVVTAGISILVLASFVFWLASGPTLLGCCGSVVNPT